MYTKIFKLRYSGLLLTLSSISTVGYASQQHPLVQQADALRTQMAALTNGITTLDAEKQQAEQQLQIAQSDLQAKNAQLLDVIKDKTKLIAEKSKLESELNDLKTVDLQRKDAEIGKLTKDNADKDSRIQQLTGDITNLNSAIQTKDQEISTLRSDVSTLTQERDDARQKLHSLEAYNEGNISKYEGEFGTSKGALKRSISGLFDAALEQRNDERVAHARTAQDLDQKEAARAALESALQNEQAALIVQQLKIVILQEPQSKH